MSSSNDLTISAPVQVTARVSHLPGTYDKAETAADALQEEPVSLIADAVPGHGAAAVGVYQPPGSSAALARLWTIWNRTATDADGTVTTTLISTSGHYDGIRLVWSPFVPVKDTQGNIVESALTPSLAVLNDQMHLIVVKPDGRGTLAHYIYIDSASAWEYNAGWDVQPLTTASPSVTTFSTSNLLYIAFTVDDAVSVCAYTPSTTPGVTYGTWSAPAATGVPSTDAPALFTSPRRTGPELHLAVAGLDKLVKEYAMGSSLDQWTESSLQPGGTSQRGVGACNTASEAFLTAPTASDDNPTFQYTTWTEDGNTWPASWTNFGNRVAYGNIAPVVFNMRLHCFFIAFSGSVNTLNYIAITLHGSAE